ncbi:hypothetical protein COK56_27060 [Bacillus cereus]|nr:hypothetical protein CON05_12025 [Bacillus cereus]PFS73351.1 hypothetical protein COK56_27060 [Bacillus cereus]
MKTLSIADFTYYRDDLLTQYTDQLDVISYKRPHIEKGDANVFEAKEKWGIEFLLLRLLQHAQLSANPRQMSKLLGEVNNYNKTQPKNPINFKDIIEQGWVREIWGQWFLPRNVVFNLPRFKDQSHVLIPFLKKLKLVPYPDIRVFIIDKLNEIVEQHCNTYKDFPGISWLYKEEIVQEHDDFVILNVQSKYIEDSANYLLAKLWEEKLAGPDDIGDRLSWLMERFELFQSGWNFVGSLHSKAREEFLDACLERLLNEEDLIGWDSEKLKIAIERTLDMEELPQDIPLPSHKLIDQLHWCDQNHLEDYIHVNRSRMSLQILFNWILEFENTSIRSDRERFIKLLESAAERPAFMEFLLESTRDKQHNIIAFLLTQKKYVSIGLYLLSNVIRDGELRRGKYLRSDVYEVLWDEGLLFAFYTLSTCSEEELADLLIDIATFLSEKVMKGSLDNNPQKEKISKKNWLTFLNRMEHLNEAKISLNIERIYALINHRLSERMESEKFPFQHHLWCFYQWSLNKSITKRWNKDTVGKQCSQFLKQYRTPFLSLPLADDYIKFKPIEHSKSWVQIASCCEQKDSTTWKRFIESGERLLELMEEAKLDHKTKLNCTLLLKNHINLLANLIKSWPKKDTIPEILRTQFKEMVFYGLGINAEDAKTEFIFKLEPIFYQKQKEQHLTLLKDTSEALLVLTKGDRQQVIEKIKSSQGLLFATVLYNHITNEEEKAELRDNMLPAFNKATQQQDFIIPELFAIINELLNSEEEALVEIVVDLANEYEPKMKRNVEWEEWLTSVRLQLAYFYNDHDFISMDSVPEEYQNKPHMKLKLSFYEGLVKLDKEDESIKEAFTHFTNLRKNEPDNLAIAVNQVAAYVRKANYIIKQEQPDNLAKNKLAAEAEDLFHEIDGEFYPFEDSKAHEIYVSNRLYFYLLMEDTNSFWRCFHALSEDIKYTLKVGTYTIQLFMLEKRLSDASILLDRLKELYGNLPLFDQIEKELKEEEDESINVTPPDFIEHLFDIRVVGQAVKNLTQLQVKEQIKAVRGDVPWEQYFVERVIHISNKVQEYSPNLKTRELLAGEEDRYTDLFKYLYDESMRVLGWTVSTQVRGGVTSKETDTGRGGVGERDLTFYSGQGTNLALGEALVLSGANTAVITDHVRKAFSYDIPATNYCIIINWGYANKVEEVWESYKEIIREKCDFGEYEILESGTLNDLYPDLTHVPDYQFYTKHKTEHKGEEAYMIHLYIDVKHKERVLLRN